MRSSFYSILTLGASVAASPVYSSSAKRWQKLAPIPSPRQEQATVALSDTKIAIVGGIVSNENGTGVVTTDLVQVYDIPSDSWSTVEPLPSAMNHPNAAVVNGKLYLLGGLTPEETAAWQATTACWVYDPEGDVWAELEDMPEDEGRGSATIVLVPGPAGEQRSVATVTTYDTETGEWSVWPSLPLERDHAGGAVIDGKMYVLGGRRFGQTNVTDTVFSLDLSSPEEGWTTSDARMPTPRGGLAAGTVSVKAKDGYLTSLVYTFGGEGNGLQGSDGMFDEVEVFDPRDGGSWAQKGRMPIAKHGTAAVSVGGRVYIPGGGIRVGGSPVSDFEAYFP
ncbi:hypothetical protein NLU13_9912 [Sarocladium strictum]|uniref:Galactose oxidase n=1 Tax=Sarocladium strictum TaxID=5046 RepID=A0AA39L3I3_SARSR|nr:hypothetical protein NLU13_9912 [Sarocladium strictum]